MKRIIVCRGLDYHQKLVQVCVIEAQSNLLLNRNCQHNWRRIVKAVRAVAPHAVVQAAIEACSDAANLAEELVSRREWSVDLAHPGYVSRMKQSPDKTDFSDARLLASRERGGGD